MFGKSKRNAESQTKMAVEGVLEIVYMNARRLGYHLVNDKIPRELADKSSFIGAVAGLAESTCGMLGAHSQETICSVIGHLFKNGQVLTPKDATNAFQILEKSIQSPDFKAAFLEVRSYLESLAGTPDSSDNRDMLFLVEYMKPEEANPIRSEPSGMTSHATMIEPDNELVPVSDLSGWEEYSSINQGPAPVRETDRSPGSSFRTAIEVKNTLEEYAWMERLYPGMEMATQSLYENEGKDYDVLEGRDKNDNSHKIYFDISAFY